MTPIVLLIGTMTGNAEFAAEEMVQVLKEEFGREDKDTFNFGGKRFDDILAELGAKRLGERSKHDIRSDVQPWDYAKAWLRAWYAARRA